MREGSARERSLDAILLLLIHHGVSWLNNFLPLDPFVKMRGPCGNRKCQELGGLVSGPVTVRLFILRIEQIDGAGQIIGCACCLRVLTASLK